MSEEIKMRITDLKEAEDVQGSDYLLVEQAKGSRKVKVEDLPFSGGPGGTGKPGKDGKSAYQIWLDAGNTGSEAQFLASLKGPKESLK